MEDKSNMADERAEPSVSPFLSLREYVEMSKTAGLDQ